ncbi:MAG: hypothetical protein EOO87_17720 [Pedobacter sp.]|nr:MAG: hypothetical protein EOO87_17720 [Pedobacter sp.]
MELFNYLLKVSACTALFYAFYLLVLRKLTFFKTNRFYLLATLILSFVIPSLQFKIEGVASNLVVHADKSRSGNQFVIIESTASEHLEKTFATQFIEVLNNYSLLFYATVVSILLVVALFKLIYLLANIKKEIKVVNGLKLVNKSKGFTNCSFFNYIFIDENKLSEVEIKVLLNHEEVHAKQYHSADKLLLTIVKAILWFNPIVYLYDKALEQVHEYEADEKTSQECGREDYASLLLRLAVSEQNLAYTHGFVTSPVKKRIIMLFNSKSEKMKKLTYLFALPITIGLVWIFSTEIVYAQNLKNEVVEVPKVKSTVGNNKVMEVPITENRQATEIKEVAIKPKSKSSEILINNGFYERYEMIDEGGEVIDHVKISLGSKSSGTAFVPKNGQVIIIINGINYTEDQVKVMDKSVIENIKSLSVTDDFKSMQKYFPDLVNKCDAVISLPAKNFISALNKN